MIRPNWRRRFYKYKTFAAGSVVFFCILLWYGVGSNIWGTVEKTLEPTAVAQETKNHTVIRSDEHRDNANKSGKGTSMVPVSANTDSELSVAFDAPQLLLSSRMPLNVLPLTDVFYPVTGLESVTMPHNVTEKQTSKDAINISNTPKPRALNSGPSRTTPPKPPKVIGVIMGSTPLAMMVHDGMATTYAIGEGPEGYRIMEISPEKVIWERGLAWER